MNIMTNLYDAWKTDNVNGEEKKPMTAKTIRDKTTRSSVKATRKKVEANAATRRKKDQNIENDAWRP